MRKVWIARDDGPEVRILLPGCDQPRPLGIVKDVENGVGEFVRVPFVVAENVIVALRLQFGAGGSEELVPVTAKKPAGTELVGFGAEAHPEEMAVVRHQAVGGAMELVA